MQASTQLKFTSADRTDINHPLLYNLITYGDGSDTRIPIGNWNSWSFGARGILTWLVMDALNVKRYPWHPDVCQAHAPQGKEAKGVLRIIEEHLDSPRKIQDALDEVRRIYDHTQSVFMRHGIQSIKLHRSLYDGDVGSRVEGYGGYASKILSMSEAAKELQNDRFEIPTNVLTSWCEAAEYSDYPVTIQVEHPVENIVWGSDVIASKGWHPMQSAVESGEWVVLNRSLDGRLCIPLSGVFSRPTPSQWIPAHKHHQRLFSSEDQTSEERARQYLDHQRSNLAPLKGYTMPHYHSGLLHLNWRDRLKIAMRVLKTR